MVNLFERVFLRFLRGKYIFLKKSELTYTHDLLYTYHNADFLNDKKFKEAYHLSKSIDSGELLRDYDIEWRIHVLCWAAEHAAQLDGDFIDFGCGSGIFARAINHYLDLKALHKTYYMLDTFYGLDSKYSTTEEYNSDLNSLYRKKNAEQRYNSIVNNFKEFPVKIIKGAVPQTLPQIGANKLAFISIDMNAAEPEIAALEFCWKKLVPGGIIILDDYGYNNQFMQQKNAHDKFAQTKGVGVLSIPTCQGLIIKPA